MRVCGTFCRLGDLIRDEQRAQTHATARERVGAALLSIDDTDGGSALETGVTNRVDGSESGAARGDNVLDETHELARRKRPFEPVRGAVLLLLLADDQERQAARERRRRGKRDGSELRRRHADRIRLVRLDLGGDRFTERGEEVRASLEAVLVEVVPGATPGTQQEVAFEVRVLAECSG